MPILLAAFALHRRARRRRRADLRDRLRARDVLGPRPGSDDSVRGRAARDPDEPRKVKACDRRPPRSGRLLRGSGGAGESGAAVEAARSSAAILAGAASSRPRTTRRASSGSTRRCRARGAAPVPARGLRPAAAQRLPRVLAVGLERRARGRADGRAHRARRGLPGHWAEVAGDVRRSARASPRRFRPPCAVRRASARALGVASSKVVAKIASDRRKPGGLTVVPPGREAVVPRAVRRAAPARRRPARRGNGCVAPRASRRSARSRRFTDADLQRLLPGKVGLLLRDRARGIDPRPLETVTRNASRSRPRRPSSATSPTVEQLKTSCGEWPIELAEHLQQRARPPAR